MKLKFFTLPALLLFSIQIPLLSQTFTEINSLTGVEEGTTTWGDYDQNGQLDLLVTGTTSGTSGNSVTQVYRNNFNASFSSVKTLTGLSFSSAEWGDYDNDGDLDILVSGITGSTAYTKLFEYDGSTWNENTGVSLTGLYSGDVDWGDYDNDGDLDVLLTGTTDGSSSGAVTKIYRNTLPDSIGFEEQTSINLTDVWFGSAEWADYDKDGDLDILLTGNSQSDWEAMIYSNNGNNSFTEETGITLTGVSDGQSAWADYDSDGYPDLLITGTTTGLSNDAVTLLYRNNGDNSFTRQLNTGLDSVATSSVDWGDYDNDGDPDILLSGLDPSGTRISKIFRNNADNTFTEDEVNNNLVPVSHSSSQWGDYDNDGDLDIVLSGYTGTGQVIKIYRNNLDPGQANQPPGAPAGLQSEVTGDTVTLTWTRATDTETSQNGLSYNIYILDTTFTKGIRPVSADTTDGQRWLAKAGSIRDTSYTLFLPGTGQYMWSVQAVDAGLEGGGFAPPAYFSVSGQLIYGEEQFVGKDQEGDPLNVLEIPEATSREWKYSTTAGGPYQSFSTAETGEKYTPQFDAVDEYYIICESIIDSETKTSNEIKVTIPEFYPLDTPPLEGAHGEWGDYDNDGDLDFLYFAQLYRNDGNDQFTKVQSLPAGNGYFGDYDLDGDLDVMVSGRPVSTSYFKIYMNNETDANNFVLQEDIQLTGLYSGDAAWGDADNDGDLDIFHTGSTGSSGAYFYYKNEGNNSFVYIPNILSSAGVYYSSVSWGDYDNDSDLDLLISGSTGTFTEYARLFRNEGGDTFTEETGISLEDMTTGSLSWGDYNNDGFLDILVSGGYTDSKVYKNNGDSTFTEQTGIELPYLTFSSGDWGDYDNDGDLDILLTGKDGTEYTAAVYTNNGDNTFSLLENNPFPDTYASTSGTSGKWGDYDDDGDLDILLGGNIYKNNLDTENEAPASPVNLQTSVTGDSIYFTWDQATDTETPQDGLSYHLFIYETTSRLFETASEADTASGKRLLSRIGSLQTNAHWLKLPAGNYEWSVQAVDAGLKGGLFADRAEFSVSGQHLNVARQVIEVNTEGDTLTVQEVPVATSREWKYSTTPGGPYAPFDPPQTGMTLVPQFEEPDTFYIICESTIDAVDHTSDEVEIVVPLYFRQDSIKFTQLEDGTSSWADYDMDGDMDLLMTGQDQEGDEYSLIYRNEGDNSFTEQTHISLTGVTHASADWGDYDNDGYPDLLLTGTTNGSVSGASAKIYRNTGENSFVEETEVDLPGIYEGNAEWGDFDNDGDLDILLAGENSTVTAGKILKIYINNGDHTFTDYDDLGLFLSTTFEQNLNGTWGDFDNDGFLDLITIRGTTAARYYRNNGFDDQGRITFTDVYQFSPATHTDGILTGDYDNDGDLDVLMSAYLNPEYKTSLYRNNGDNTFTEQGSIILPEYDLDDVALVDYDNDGYLDILTPGALHLNNQDNSFSAVNFPLKKADGDASWADYDEDGDIDLFSLGEYYNSVLFETEELTAVYRNGINQDNQAPTAPANLVSTVVGDSVVFHWDQSTDNETPQEGLSYDLLVYDLLLDSIIKSLPADTATGNRFMARFGEIQADSFWLNIPVDGLYAWRVQAVDGGYKGSPLSAVASFSVGEQTILPRADQSLYPYEQGDTILVFEATEADSREWKYATASGGPYQSFDTPETGSTHVPEFGFTGDYYIICESITGEDTLVSNEIMVQVEGFTEVTGLNLAADDNRVLAWGDYDSDGDLDLFMADRLYENEGNDVFTERVEFEFQTLNKGAADWGDYDGDGDLDLLLAGDNTMLKVYKNAATDSFPEVDGILSPGSSNINTAEWGDYDNDGDLDILLSNTIFRNNGTDSFAEPGENIIPDYTSGDAAWGDYDNDGDLDILFCGYINSNEWVSRVYRNDGDQGFTEQATNLSRAYGGDMEWGDLNNDGYLDIIQTGLFQSNNPNIDVYFNNGDGTFTEFSDHGMTQTYLGSVETGDYDNDGDLDVLSTGRYTISNAYNNSVSHIYRNNGDSTFTAEPNPMLPVHNSRAAWGDYDNDGDLDVALLGYYYYPGESKNVAEIIRNNYQTANTAPGTPDNLSSSVDTGKVTFSWDNPDDAETPRESLTHNMYVYEADSSNFVSAPQAFQASSGMNGKRLLAEHGQIRLSQDGYVLIGLTPGRSYKWSVQSVDGGLMGGPFAAEQSFSLPELPVITSQPMGDTVCAGDTIELNLQASGSGPLTFVWQYSNDSISFESLTDTSWYSGMMDTSLVITTNTDSVSGLYRCMVFNQGGIVYSDTVSVSVHLLPVASLGPDREICAGDSVVLDPGAGFDAYLWNEGGSEQTLTIKESGTYAVTVTDSNGCKATAEAMVTVHELPEVSLGTDLTICPGESLLLDPGGFTAYEWSDGTVEQTLEVDTAGMYSVSVTDTNGCVNSSSIMVDMHPSSGLDLGPDQEICEGESIVVDAGSFAGYQWSNGANTRTIETDSTGTYGVVVTTADGCLDSASVTITVNQLPVVSLGIDQELCKGDSLVLDAGSFSGYSWNTGSQDQTVTVDTSGSFIVEVTDDNNCRFSDTISVMFHPVPVVDLGTDRELCAGDTLTIDAGEGFENYDWSTFSALQRIEVTGEGEYTVTVTDANGCEASDTLMLTILDLPQPELGADESFCEGDSLVLDPGSFESYLWSNGSTDQTLVVDSSGTYSVTVSSVNGCENTDEVFVTVHPSPVVDLGGDQKICENGAAGLDAGTGFSRYEWEDGSSSRTRSVLESGTYTVTVTDINLCTASDSVVVMVVDTPAPSLGNDTSICPGDTLVLDPGAWSSYQWSNGTNNRTIEVYTNENSSGTIGNTVTVTDSLGCQGTAEINISLLDLPEIDLPFQINTICPGADEGISAGEFETYLWSDGTTDPVFYPDTAGTFSVTVTDTNGCSNEAEFFVSLAEQPVADFDITIDDKTVTFLNQSTGFGEHEWNFGDGNTSVDMNPVYTFAEYGSQTVSLRVSNGVCKDSTITRTIPLIASAVPSITADDGFFNVFPNPATDQVRIASETGERIVKLEILDVNSRILEVIEFTDHVFETEIELSEQVRSQSVVFLRIRGEENLQTGRLIIVR